MKKKLITSLAIGLSCVTLLAGCGKKTADNAGDNSTADQNATEGYIKATDLSKNPSDATARKDTLVIGVEAPDEVFNPLYADSAYDMYVNGAMFDGMVSVDGKGLPEENMASWTISDDKKTYTFKLKDGLKFSDGSELTADDVAFTYTIMCDKSYDGPSDVVNTLKISGAKDYQDGKSTAVSGIKVVDKQTIAFTLDEVNADAIYSFGSGILPKAIYGKDYKQGSLDYIKALHKTPVGAGQYKFVSSKAGQEVVLVANENYFKGEPKIKNIIYKVTSEDTRIQMLKTGQIDMDMVTVNQDNVQTIQDLGFMDLHIFPTNGYGYIGMNIKDPKFQDPKVRQALTYGLNRKDIVEAVYGKYADVVNVPQSKESWAYSAGKNDYAFDTEKAKQLLDEAGWKVGADGIREKDGVKFEVKFTATTPNPVNDAIIPVAQQNFQDLGIKFTAEQMDFNAMKQKLTAGSFEMFFMAWGLTPTPDAYNIFATDGAQNRTGYSNKEVDKLFQDGLKETDTEKRKAIYADVLNKINEDAPYIFMYQRRDAWAVNGRVKGFDNEITPYKDFTASLYKLTLE